MSDEEDVKIPVAKKKTKVNFGSLANQETLDRLSAQDTSHVANINVSKATFDMDKIADPGRDMAMAEFERRKRARHLALPTGENEVKDMFRQLGHPICLFGENKADRRERLRALISEMDVESAHQILHREEPVIQQQKLDESTWYHEGSENLRQARIFLAQYSLPRAQKRLAKSREERSQAAHARALRMQETDRHMRAIAIYGSQVGDSRAVSYCSFSPDSDMIATASWSGLCKLWQMPDCKLLKTFRGHRTNSDCIVFHPESTQSLSSSVLNLASCAHDGSVLLWNLESEKPMAELHGHSRRVSRIAFHPSGRFLATCCHDNSWRLFDLEKSSEEILFQEGHSKPVFDIDFQCDGSLALTGGMDCYGRVWDLRTGRCIMFLEGHQKHIVSAIFAPNGYQMTTGSADNSIKMWDLRMRRITYTIPAHKSLVSKVKFDANGHYFVSGSFDHTVKIWSNPGWQQLKELHGHSDHIMCVDVSPDRNWIVSASKDKTFKLWTTEK